MPAFDPPKFAGNADESLDQWIKDINEYAQCVQWAETQKLSSLPMLLSGRARQVYQDLPPNDKTSWNNAMSKLQESFGLDTSSDILTFQRLDRMQGRSESVRDYAKDIIQRLRDAGITDDRHMRFYFHRGLLPKIKKELMAMKPTSLKEMERYACATESNIQSTSDITVEAVQAAVSDAVTKQFTAFNRRLGNSDETDNNTRRTRFRSPSNERDNSNERRSSYDERRSDRSSSYARGNTYRGRQRSYHNSNYTRGTFRDNRPRESYCRQCSLTHAWGEHRNPTCAKCRRRGHVAGNCTQNF